MPTRFRPLAAVVTAATLTATLAGCASPLPHKAAPEATDRINDLRRNHSELPAGAELEAAGTQEGHVPDVDGAEPSWRAPRRKKAGALKNPGAQNGRRPPPGRPTPAPCRWRNLRGPPATKTTLGRKTTLGQKTRPTGTLRKGGCRTSSSAGASSSGWTPR